jgi:RNA polymerase sigma-70 factor (ECF subfamily)
MIFLVLNTKDEVLLVEAIYNKYSKFMFKVAYNVLHNNYDAEDAVQQAFLRIIDNVDKIGDLEDKKTRNFIGVICHNVAINIYNKAKKAVATENEEVSDTEYDVSVIVIDNEACKKLERFIYGLDDIYKELLLLKAQGYSIKEISEVLKINPKTAQKRLERGRIKIKNFLAKEGKCNV